MCIQKAGHKGHQALPAEILRCTDFQCAGRLATGFQHDGIGRFGLGQDGDTTVEVSSADFG